MVRLDVVAELAAHQHNLAPDAVAARTALIALPPPRLAALIAPGWCAAARAAELAALADELGGGDGPVAIVDVAAPGDALQVRLAQLWERGIRALIVHGARDQPGYARALRYRWAGALRVLGGSLLDAVLDPVEPIRALAPGVVRVAPGVAAPAAELVLAAVDVDGDPRRVRAQGPRVWPYAIDRARRLGAWAGIAPPVALLGTAAGAQARARWDAYWSEHGHDVVRPAVLGLDPALEASLRDEVRPHKDAYWSEHGHDVVRPALEADLRDEVRPPPARRAKIIAITGIDGSGKSTQVARLARALRDRGARTSVLKLYRQGAFLELANQLGARTRRGAPLAAFRASRVVKLVDSLRVFRDHLAPALAACDAVIMDRYVETHVAAAGSQLGWDLTGHPALAPFPAADLRFWLELDPVIALARREARGEPPSADEHATGLRGYADVFARLARTAPTASAAPPANASRAASGSNAMSATSATMASSEAHGSTAMEGSSEARGSSAMNARTTEVVLDATNAEQANARAIAQRVNAIVPSGRDPTGSVLTPPRALPLASSQAVCAVHIGVDAALPALGAEVLGLREELERWSGAAAVPEGFWLEAYAAQLVLDVIVMRPARGAIALWPGAVAGMADHGELVMLEEIERMLAPLVEVESCDLRPASYEGVFAALGAAPAAARRLAREYVDQLERVALALGWRRAPSE